MTPARGWVVALAGVIALTALSAFAVLLAGSAMMAEADAYFGQYDFSDPAGAVVVDQPEFDSYTVLYSTGSTLTGVASPLLLCTIGATVTLLAVLSARRDGQAGAPAAS
ncbi:MAG: hypothetical protein AB7K08_04345 [Microbacteriaceae bacterium]